MAAALRRRWARRHERSLFSNRAVAVHAIDFDSGTRLAVDFSIAVIVLGKVTVIALHSFFQVNVGQVNCFPETVGIVKSNLLAVLVEPIPFAIVTENGAENPAVSVEISKLGGLQLLVEF